MPASCICYNGESRSPPHYFQPIFSAGVSASTRGSVRDCMHPPRPLRWLQTSQHPRREIFLIHLSDRARPIAFQVIPFFISFYNMHTHYPPALAVLFTPAAFPPISNARTQQRCVDLRIQFYSNIVRNFALCHCTFLIDLPLRAVLQTSRCNPASSLWLPLFLASNV